MRGGKDITPEGAVLAFVILAVLVGIMVVGVAVSFVMVLTG